MSYFPDLTEYAYADDSRRPHTVNVGWLDDSHHFETGPSSDKILEAVWQYCKISVAAMRGGIFCAFCDSEYSERNGEKLFLGTAEIRVFGGSGEIFAAPNLIYHYMLAHSYLPPKPFIAAIETGPNPPRSEYFEKLDSLDLEWTPTPIPSEFGSMRVEDYPRWKKLNISMMEYLRMRHAGALPEDV